MELVHRIVSDFLLFSLGESLIFSFYFKRIGNCRGFGIVEVFIIGLVNCIISQLIPPTLYQFLAVIWMGCYLYLFKNKTILVGLYLSTCAIVLMLVIEMIMAMFYENVLNINFMNLKNIELFITIIPMKLIELILIYGGDKMKMWYGSIEKRK